MMTHVATAPYTGAMLALDDQGDVWRKFREEDEWQPVNAPKMDFFWFRNFAAFHGMVLGEGLYFSNGGRSR